MRRRFLLILPLIFSLGVADAFSEKGPIASLGWRWKSAVQLNGEWFTDIAESYREQDGWVVDEEGNKLHCWLYDSYTYHNGYVGAIRDEYLPKWLESMGYIIDFDHIGVADREWPRSVRALMRQRHCDLCVILTEGPLGRLISTPGPALLMHKYSKEMMWSEYWRLIVR